jgi:hypothetical protein
MKRAIQIFLLAVLMNIVLTTIINRVKHKEKSETELFLDIPKSFIWKYDR